MSKCPVTGLDCPHKKVIHATEVANNQATQELHMCVACGVPFMTQNGGPEFNAEAFQLFEVLNTMIKNPHVAGGTVVIEPKLPLGCPTCGCTVENFLMTGKLGCGNCYEFYKKELLPFIEKCQAGAVKHMGKTPKAQTIDEKTHALEEKLKKAFAKEPEVPKALLIKKLEAQLQEAVAAENYALCAKLRDEIKRLKE